MLTTCVSQLIDSDPRRLVMERNLLTVKEVLTAREVVVGSGQISRVRRDGGVVS